MLSTKVGRVLDRTRISEDDGMFTFNRCMFNLVEEGKITKEIAMANATNPQQLEMWFQGIQINTGIV